MAKDSLSGFLDCGLLPLAGTGFCWRSARNDKRKEHGQKETIHPATRDVSSSSELNSRCSSRLPCATATPLLQHSAAITFHFLLTILSLIEP